MFFFRLDRNLTWVYENRFFLFSESWQTRWAFPVNTAFPLLLREHLNLNPSKWKSLDSSSIVLLPLILQYWAFWFPVLRTIFLNYQNTIKSYWGRSSQHTLWDLTGLVLWIKSIRLGLNSGHRFRQPGGHRVDGQCHLTRRLAVKGPGYE